LGDYFAEVLLLDQRHRRGQGSRRARLASNQAGPVDDFRTGGFPPNGFSAGV
jgi:hypothetical protein